MFQWVIKKVTYADNIAEALSHVDENIGFFSVMVILVAFHLWIYHTHSRNKLNKIN